MFYFPFSPRYCLVDPIHPDQLSNILHLVVLQVPVGPDTRLEYYAFSLAHQLFAQEVYLDFCFFRIECLLIQRKHYLLMERVVEIRVVFQYSVVLVVKNIGAIYNVLALQFEGEEAAASEEGKA